MNTNTTIAPVLTLLRGVQVEDNLSVVTRGPIAHLHERDLAIIAEAEKLHAAGEKVRAAQMILGLEERLGITQEDRLAVAALVEPWEQDLMAVLKAMSAESEEEKPTPIPPRPTSFSDAELTQIDRHDQVRRIAKVRGNRKTMAQAEGKLADIARGRDRRVDLQERRDGIRETLDLAKAKGEAIEQGAGRIEISSRDGLRSMRKAGHITDAQYAIGLLYRAGFEARSGDLKAQEIGESSPGGHDNDKYVAARLRRARMLDFVARVDRLVALSCISNPAALQVLRSVAGEGKAITVWGHGRALARNRAALVTALDCALALSKQMAQDRRERLGDDNPSEASKKPGTQVTS